MQCDSQVCKVGTEQGLLGKRRGKGGDELIGPKSEIGSIARTLATNLIAFSWQVALLVVRIEKNGQVAVALQGVPARGSKNEADIAFRRSRRRMRSSKFTAASQKLDSLKSIGQV
tara:strand:+ start:1132 stop:1476 length:345 start_codon:yes stop_codon:yes gene_type:complete